MLKSVLIAMAVVAGNVFAQPTNFTTVDLEPRKPKIAGYQLEFQIHLAKGAEITVRSGGTSPKEYTNRVLTYFNERDFGQGTREINLVIKRPGWKTIRPKCRVYGKLDEGDRVVFHLYSNQFYLSPCKANNGISLVCKGPESLCKKG